MTERAVSIINQFLSALPVITLFLISALMFKNKFKDSLTDPVWIRRNRLILTVISLVQGLLFSPIAEEMVFRFPLLVFFPELNITSTIWILVSGLSFGLLHLRNSDEYYGTVMLGSVIEDDVPFDIQLRVLIDDKKKLISFLRISQTVLNMMTGVVYGFLVVHYGSIWASISAHSLWNLMSLIFLPFLMDKFLEITGLRRYIL